MEQKETIHYDSIQDIMITDQAGPLRYPLHWHNAAEFTLAKRDACIYQIGDTEYRLARGDILLIWPRELHATVKVPEKSTLFIQFSASLLENNGDLAASLRLLSKIHLLSHEEEPELALQIADLMEETGGLFADTSDMFRETRCKLKIYQILLLLADFAGKTKMRQIEGEGFSDEAWKRIREACAYIAEHHTECIRQKQAADAVGLSPCYFSRLFKKYTQVTFPQYVANCRIQTAIRLLGNSSLSVTECAYRAGFQSITAFNRVFFEITGSSPREYRRLFHQIK